MFTRSSKHRAGSSRSIWNPALGSNVGLGLDSWPTADHVLYRFSNYNPPALLISVLITIERRASCSMFARSCKHPITRNVGQKEDLTYGTNSWIFCAGIHRLLALRASSQAIKYLVRLAIHGTHIHL